MQPLPHQQQAIDKLTTTKFLILADEAGLGKTFVSLQAVKSLGGFVTVGIFAPKSTLAQWQRTADKLGITPLFIRTNSYQQVQKVMVEFSSRETPKILILDEAHQGAGNTKFAQGIMSYVRKGAGNKHVWALTASPIRDGKIINAWLFYALIKWCDKQVVPNYYQFRNQYAEFTDNKFYVGNKNEEIFHAGVSPFIFRRTYEDVGKSQEIGMRSIVAPPPMISVSELVAKYMEALCEEADDYKDFNFVSLLLHLRQELALGAVEITAKELNVLPTKCVVFSNFLAPLNKIAATTTKSSITVTGKTKKRQEAFNAFQHGDVDVLLTTFAAASTGVDLPNITNTIFNELPLESTQLHQAIMRTVRITSDVASHNKSFQFIHMGTIIDEWVLALLAGKVKELTNFISVPTLRNIPRNGLGRKQALYLLQEMIMYGY